jgi:hypothetical protein
LRRSHAANPDGDNVDARTVQLGEVVEELLRVFEANNVEREGGEGNGGREGGKDVRMKIGD